MKSGCVYLMASRRNGTLYLGVTSDLAIRSYQHRNGLVNGFSRDHDCKWLVWYEHHDDLQEARRSELQMKKMETRVEGRIDRTHESALAGPVR